MPNRTAVLHPRLPAANLFQFYPDRIAIDARTEVQDPESGESSWAWTQVPGYGSIPAVIAPVMASSFANNEVIADKGSWAVSAWHISLDGYWPNISPLDQVRMDDGRTFNILAVEHDSRRQFTRLKVEDLDIDG